MARFERFEDMEIWQKARGITRTIYFHSQQGGFTRDFGFRDQIRRAAVSIMSNIAEGFERGTNKEFIQFLYIAKGSAGEVRSQLYVAFDLGYKNSFETIYSDLLSLSKQISGFIQYLQSSPVSGGKQ